MTTTHSLRAFCKKNCFDIMVGAILFLLYFIPYLGCTYVGLDTHAFVIDPKTSYNWLSIGRQGAVLIHKLFPSAEFSMFFVESLAYVGFVVAFILFAYLFDRLAKVPVWKSGLFFLLFMVHPIWTEQLYFTIQICDAAVGVTLVAVALYFAYENRRLLWIVSILAQIWAFCIYQTYAIVYIAGCILCFSLVYIQSMREEEEKPGFYFLKLGIRQLVLFVISYGINAVITSLFFSNSDYLSGQVLWGKIPTIDAIKRIVTIILQVLKGEGVFYCYTFSASLILLIVGAVVFLIRNRHKGREKWLAVLALIVLQSTPFLMTIYAATLTAYRSQFILPFTTACNVLLFLAMLDINTKWFNLNRLAKCCIYVFVGYMLIAQYHTASQLQYTWSITRQEDERRAYAIEEQMIQESSASTKPVIFIGYDYARVNGSFVNGENVNVSVFSFGFDSELRYYDSTQWVVAFMRSLGINVCSASEEQAIAAREVAQTMPVFPREGSVKDMGDYIIVKLAADDFYASELMAPATSTSSADSLTYGEDLRAGVDTVELTDGVLSIRGWVTRQYYDSNYVSPGVHLVDDATNTVYTLASGTQTRPDLNSYFGENTDYTHSGVLAKASLEELPEEVEECRIVMSIATDDGVQYIDTGKHVSDFLTVTQ